MTDVLEFFVNGRKHTIQNVDPLQTALEYLRKIRLTSVKKSCGQGGCGACTVVVTNFNSATNSFEHRSINACLAPLAALVDCHVTTSEGLGSTKDGFHAVQQRIARSGGTQCGYCTPGMVMTMYGVLQATQGKPSLSDIEAALDGNICRCTGYRPILTAFHTFATDSTSIPEVDIEDIGKIFQLYDHSKNLDSTTHMHPAKKNVKTLHFEANGVHWYRPSTLEEVLALQHKHKGAPVRFVVGNTSSGVFGKDQTSRVWIDLRHVNTMQTIEEKQNELVVGAAVSITRLMKAIKEKNEAMANHIRRVANTSVRNAASWAGNLVMARTKGFPSDMATLLAGIGATLSVVRQHSDVNRPTVTELDVLDYLHKGEDDLVITSVTIPTPGPNAVFQSYRASARYNNSHAYVNAAFLADVQDGTFKAVRLVFGVVDVHAKRARATEAVLLGNPISFQTFQNAVSVLQKEIVPIQLDEYTTVDDPEGKGPYRQTLPEKFLYKFFLTLNRKNLSHPLSSTIHLHDRGVATGRQTYTEKPGREALMKRESEIQASGESVYSGDISVDPLTLFGAVVMASKAGVKIENVDISFAEKMDGVWRIILAKDIKGANDCGVFPNQEEILASTNSPFVGQPIAIVLAENENQARLAAQEVKVTYGDYYDGEPVFDLDTALKREKFDPSSDHEVTSGNVDDALKNSDIVVEGQIRFGGQHPFYMERLSAYVIPGEMGHFTIYTGAQNPAYCQGKVAAALGLPLNKVTIIVKRIGGGFGGRLTRNVQVVQLAAVSSQVVGRPVRLELSIQEDMTITAGRHSGIANYKVGITKEGKFKALDVISFVNAGFSTDFSFALTLEYNESLDDIYKIPNFHTKSRALRTNLGTRTATRSFGHSQAKYVIESILQHVAETIGKQPHEVAELNMYTPMDCICPNGQFLEDWKMNVQWKEMKEKAEFEKSLEEINTFNKNHKWRKRGIYLSGVKYGIHQNYATGATAQITIYGDGSVFVMHGGCDKGTGVNTKVAQAVALTLGCSVDQIRIGETNTDHIPQTGWNGGSAGTEGNVEAARRAAVRIKERMMKYKLELWSKSEDKTEPKWNQVAAAAVADNFRQTESDNFVPFGTAASELLGPKWQHHWTDYWTCGTACSSVEVDILTGEVTVLRSDILVDVGDTLNPLIDIGQVEGAFVYGMGYFLQEEELIQASGKPSDSTWTYKPMLALDIPKDFRVELAKDTSYPKNVMGFKGIGEPPMVLAYTVVGAIKQAIFASRAERGLPSYIRIDSPVSIDKRAMAGGVSTKDLKF